MKKLIPLFFPALLIAGSTLAQQFDPIHQDRGDQKISKKIALRGTARFQRNSSSDPVPNGPDLSEFDLLGGTGQNIGEHLLNMPDSSLKVFGKYHKSLSFGDKSITSDGLFTYFVADFNKDLQLQSLQNLITTTEDISVDKVHNIADGYLIAGRSDKDITIQGQTASLNDSTCFLAKFDQQNSLVWLKTYPYQKGIRNTKVLLALHQDTIYMCSKGLNITVLDNDGTQIDQYSNSGYGEFSGIAVNDSSIYLSGNMEGSYAGDIYFDSFYLHDDNNYEASFIVSLDRHDFSANWAYENSNHNMTGGDSWAAGIKLINHKLIIWGPMRYNIMWQSQLINGYFDGGYISQFSLDGNMLHTTLHDKDQIKTIIGMGNQYIATGNASDFNMANIYQAHNYYVLNDTLGLVKSFDLSPSPESYITPNDISLNYDSSKLLSTGIKDFHVFLSASDTSNLESANFMESNEFGSGVFDIRGLESDNQGNTYVYGIGEGSFSVFNDSIQTNKKSLFIIKKDKEGNILWRKQFENCSYDYAPIPKLMNYNNEQGVLGIAGYAFDSLKIDDQSMHIEGLFVAEISSDGSLKWIQKDNLNPNTIYAVSVNNDGSLYSTGRTDYSRSFIRRYSVNGDSVWFKSIQTRNLTGATMYGCSLASRGSSIFYTAEFAPYSGITSADVVIGDSDTITVSGAMGDNLILRLDEDGNVIWKKVVGGDASSPSSGNNLNFFFTAFNVDYNGDLIAAGTYDTQNDIDTITIKSRYQYSLNFLVSKFNKETGNIEWVSTIMKDDYYHLYNEIEVDQNNNVYFQNISHSDSLNFDNSYYKYFPTDGYYNYLVKYDSLGNLQWVNTDNSAYATPYGLTVHGNNAVESAGQMQGTAYIQGTTKQAYYGHSALIRYCEAPIDITSPIGDTLVMQQDTSFYKINTKSQEIVWHLEPANAGKTTVLGDSTLQVVWSDSFAGEALLSATPLNYCGMGNESNTLTVKVEAPVTAGITKKQSNAFLVYPNPAENQITIRTTTAQASQITNVDVVDIYGRSYGVKRSKGDQQQTLQVGKLAPGTYMILITTDKGRYSKVFIKK